MRICLVSFSEKTTMQKYLYYAYEYLRDSGHSVCTIGLDQLSIDKALGADNHLVHAANTPRPSVASICSAVRDARKIAELIEEINPEIVHFVNKHTWNYFLIKYLKRGNNAFTIAHTFHDPIGHFGDRIQKGVILYHRIIQRYLDGIIVHSSIAYHQTIEHIKPRTAVYRVPLGNALWKEYKPLSNVVSKQVLIFGRLNHYKGIEYYKEIADEIYSRDAEIEMLIAGKPSNDVSDSLLQSIRECPNVTLIDRFIDETEIDELFDSSMCILLPYITVTQSGVIIDAYSRSKGVVAFSIDGIREYVPYDTYLAKPFNCSELAEMVVALVNNDGLLESHNKCSWRFGKDNYTVSAMCDGLVSAYCSIRGNRKANDA